MINLAERGRTGWFLGGVVRTFVSTTAKQSHARPVLLPTGKFGLRLKPRVRGFVRERGGSLGSHLAGMHTHGQAAIPTLKNKQGRPHERCEDEERYDEAEDLDFPAAAKVIRGLQGIVDALVSHRGSEDKHDK